ncbi:MAG TPA: hypothetical protein VFQ43_07645 [Nitrososphaera sp.]|nr:hypothetical protein [Nitrososphaera sp.]
MIPHLRKHFNSNFTAEKYRVFLQQMDQHCGVHVKFRNCETPCFFPKSLMAQMVTYGEELVEQLMNDPQYLAASEEAIPFEFRVPQETRHPLFVQVDFGLVRDEAGELQPRLVEIQGFPSLYAYQPALALHYLDVYGLNSNLEFLFGGLEVKTYHQLLRTAILGDQSPENVILMEIDPVEQKTRPDFLLTERLCGIKTVCITGILKKGNFLYYSHNGKPVPIHRIYNRVIVDELVRKARSFSFRFRDDLQVEWAGHPNWFFRISKLSLPYLRHRCVPKTWFLHQLDTLPGDPRNYVLKPLFSFAGSGVIIGPTVEELAAIAPDQRANYILQERVRFESVIETPCGATKAEVRIMYLWMNELRPVTSIVRLGRGKMMGVDHNRDMEWVGASAGFYLKD